METPSDWDNEGDHLHRNCSTGSWLVDQVQVGGGVMGSQPPPPFRSTIWHHISPSPPETPPGGDGLIWLSLSHKGKVGRRWIPSPDLTPGICLSNRGPDSRAENENNESATLARTHLRGSYTRTGSCRPGHRAVLGTVEGTTTTVLPPCSEHVTQSFLWLWIKLWRSRRDIFTVFL